MKTEKKKEHIEGEQTDGNEFARFDALVKQIMSVPKKEIDRRAAEYEKLKKQKKQAQP